jgi:NTE family protein
LNELGILPLLDTITSVSGGSILAAHLAQRMQPWPEQGTAFENWDQQIANPFFQFTSRNIRTWPILKRWLFPWNWGLPGVQAKTLMNSYKKHITGMILPQLPEKPRFIFCATDITFGVNWIFQRDKVGDWQAGYISPAPQWPVAFAVTTSSCFPPIFDPMRLPPSNQELSGGNFRTEPGVPERDRLIAGLRLSDGGVYDNLGTEPVWKDHQVILVSDAGAPFLYKNSTTSLGRVKRSFSVINKQSGAIRKRWLIANFKEEVMDGTYWGIGSGAERYDPDAVGYSKQLVREVVSRVRTDLNAFSKAEVAVLENHGYLLADAAIQRHMSDLVKIKDAPLNIPHPEWMDENRVREALVFSHKRFSFKRWLRRIKGKE